MHSSRTRTARQLTVSGGFVPPMVQPMVEGGLPPIVPFIVGGGGLPCHGNVGGQTLPLLTDKHE